MPTMIKDVEIAGMAYMGKEIAGFARGGSIAFEAFPVIYSVTITPSSVPVNTPFTITAQMNISGTKLSAYNQGSTTGLSQSNITLTPNEDGSNRYTSTIALGSTGKRTLEFYARDADNNKSPYGLAASVTITAS